MSVFGKPDINKLKSKRDIKRLIKALGSKNDPDVRQAASSALVEIGFDATEPLIKALESRDEMVRNAANDILDRISNMPTRPKSRMLKEYLEDQSRDN